MIAELLPQVINLLNNVIGLLTPLFWYWLNILELFVFI
jgi:hypothetical protein